MSDAVWLAIIGVFAMGVKEYFDRDRAKTAKKEAVAAADEVAGHAREVRKSLEASTNKAAANVEEVKNALEEKNADTDAKLAELAETAHSTHILVNSSYGTALKTIVMQARLIHSMKGTKESGEALREAEMSLASHEAKQAVVDSVQPYGDHP